MSSMATGTRRNSDDRRQPSRLQRRAPSSIQINPVSDWNVAIPLLSPLITSPSFPNQTKSEIKATKEESRRVTILTEPVKPVVYKKWQHPAAPFCYDPAPPLMTFVSTGLVDRS